MILFERDRAAVKSTMAKSRELMRLSFSQRKGGKMEWGNTSRKFSPRLSSAHPPIVSLEHPIFEVQVVQMFCSNDPCSMVLFK